MIDKKTGQQLKRKKQTCTRAGIVLTSKDCKIWQIRIPTVDGESEKRYGCATTSRLVTFFLLLDMGHNIDDADKIAFRKTRLRGKYFDKEKE